jgi:hypothetical protein
MHARVTYYSVRDPESYMHTVIRLRKSAWKQAGLVSHVRRNPNETEMRDAGVVHGYHECEVT